MDDKMRRKNAQMLGSVVERGDGIVLHNGQKAIVRDKRPNRDHTGHYYIDIEYSQGNLDRLSTYDLSTHVSLDDDSFDSFLRDRSQKSATNLEERVAELEKRLSDFQNVTVRTICAMAKELSIGTGSFCDKLVKMEEKKDKAGEERFSAKEDEANSESGVIDFSTDEKGM